MNGIICRWCSEEFIANGSDTCANCLSVIEWLDKSFAQRIEEEELDAIDTYEKNGE